MCRGRVCTDSEACKWEPLSSELRGPPRYVQRGQGTRRGGKAWKRAHAIGGHANASVHPPGSRATVCTFMCSCLYANARTQSGSIRNGARQTEDQMQRTGSRECSKTAHAACKRCLREPPSHAPVCMQRKGRHERGMHGNEGSTNRVDM